MLTVVGDQTSADLNLIEAALDAGNVHASHFYRSVREYYGYTPTQIFEGSRRLAG